MPVGSSRPGTRTMTFLRLSVMAQSGVKFHTSGSAASAAAFVRSYTADGHYQRAVLTLEEHGVWE